MSKKIFFDLDGTLYDLYNIENWLDSLQNEDATVFERGNFIGNYDEFIAIVKELMFKGYTFGVISWLPMYATPEFENECAEVKRKWEPIIEKMRLPYQSIDDFMNSQIQTVTFPSANLETSTH